jgi:hypothetical protein
VRAPRIALSTQFAGIHALRGKDSQSEVDPLQTRAQRCSGPASIPALRMITKAGSQLGIGSDNRGNGQTFRRTQDSVKCGSHLLNSDFSHARPIIRAVAGIKRVNAW